MNIKQLGFALILAASSLGAQAAPANVLIYISPLEYSHSVKLWHFYYDHWFEQGPVVEPLAISMLSEEYGEAAMCDRGSAGRSLVWIKPRMYYNPHMMTYYGEIKANSYTSSGEPIASYIGEAKKVGFLDVYPQLQIEQVYKMAMENLISQMRADQNLKSVAAEGAVNLDAASACAAMANLPSPKPVDLDYFIKPVN